MFACFGAPACRFRPGRDKREEETQRVESVGENDGGNIGGDLTKLLMSASAHAGDRGGTVEPSSPPHDNGRGVGRVRAAGPDIREEWRAPPAPSEGAGVRHACWARGFRSYDQDSLEIRRWGQAEGGESCRHDGGHAALRTQVPTLSGAGISEARACGCQNALMHVIFPRGFLFRKASIAWALI